MFSFFGGASAPETPPKTPAERLAATTKKKQAYDTSSSRITTVLERRINQADRRLQVQQQVAEAQKTAAEAQKTAAEAQKLAALANKRFADAQKMYAESEKSQNTGDEKLIAALCKAEENWCKTEEEISALVLEFGAYHGEQGYDAQLKGQGLYVTNTGVNTLLRSKKKEKMPRVGFFHAVDT